MFWFSHGTISFRNVVYIYFSQNKVKNVQNNFHFEELNHCNYVLEENARVKMLNANIMFTFKRE